VIEISDLNRIDLKRPTLSHSVAFSERQCARNLTHTCICVLCTVMCGARRKSRWKKWENHGTLSKKSQNSQWIHGHL